jgi:superfamily II DNA or RNA helicase
LLFRFEEDAVFTKLIEGDWVTVDKLLCIPDPGRAQDYSFRAGMWDGLKHFFDKDKQRLPSGLFPRLELRLRNRGHEVVTSVTPLVTLGSCKPTAPDCLEGIDLRDYQVQGVNAALEYRRGILWHATNAGKTEILAAIVANLSRQLDLKGLVIVPNLTVLMEISKRLPLRLGGNPRVVVWNKTKKVGPVTVVTYQSLDVEARKKGESSKLIEFSHECDFVMTDETHHAQSPAYQKILMGAQNAFWRIGFTGTADKSTKRKDAEVVAKSKDGARWHRWHMEQFLGPVIDRIDNAFMIEQGYSAKPKIIVIDDRNCFGPTVITPKGKITADGSYEPPPNLYGKVFKLAATQDTKWVKNVVKCIRLLTQAKKPPFVFTHSIEHIEAIEAMCKVRGVECKVLHGKHSDEERIKVLKEYDEKQDFAVLTSTIFSEGLSISGMRSLILAGARKTPVELLQRIGRGIRAKEEDNTVLVVDFVPSHSDMLRRHALERLAVYRDQGFEVVNVKDVTRLTEFLL